MNYQSSALQDRFAALILNFKRGGYFLDIGSCGAVSCNNTYAFEDLGWKGICIEMDPQHNASYDKRKCVYMNTDALQVDYEALLKDNNAPDIIDFLSLDIDEKSTEVLEILPLKDFTFRVITVEHDEYIHGPRYRDRQRDILSAAGYTLLCPDVLVPIQHDTKPNTSFEDWWVKEGAIARYINGQRFERMYPKDIIDKLT